MKGKPLPGKAHMREMSRLESAHVGLPRQTWIMTNDHTRAITFWRIDSDGDRRKFITGQAEIDFNKKLHDYWKSLEEKKSKQIKQLKEVAEITVNK